MRFGRKSSKLTIFVDEKKGRSLRLMGSLRYLNRPQKFTIERYFTRWGTLYDIRLLPKFLKDAQGVGLSLDVSDSAVKFYENEIARRTVILDASIASGKRLAVTAKSKGEDFHRTIKRVISTFCKNGGTLENPLDAFMLEEKVKLAEGIVEYSESFKKLFPAFMKDTLSIEPSQSFFGQISVRHIRASISEKLRLVLDEFVDSLHLLKEPEKLDEFLSRVRKVGGKLRVLPEALTIARKAQTIEKLIVTNKEAPAKSLDAAIARGLLSVPIKPKLYRFQQKGVAFLLMNGRALLADDMGLGKTIQAITAAVALRHYEKIKRVLVVCPASLKLQWEREIKRFTNESVKVVSGEAREREFIYEKLKEDGAPLFTIINYELTYRDTKHLKEIDWDLLILDEAQRIKNFRTQTYSAIKSLPNKYVYALSGTPLETELYELYNIMDFIRPGVLPENPLKFRERYCQFDAFGKIRGYKNVAEVQRKISAVTLRRTKEDTLSELPPVIETPIWLEMDEKQKKIYLDVKNGLRNFLTREQWNELTLKNVMVELMRLREICDSPRIHFPEMNPSPKEKELLVLLREQVEGRQSQAIVFTQWTRMAELIAEMLKDEKLSFGYLHGGVDADEREILVREFQTGKHKIFLSTDAGGVGLNLQAASLVINFDLPWNPAKLDQRISRAHRLGQEGPVNVINLLMSGSIEENLVRILEKRKRLFHEVFSAWEEGGKPEQITIEKYLKDTRELVEELLM